MAEITEVLATRSQGQDLSARLTASREWIGEGILPDAVYTADNFNDVFTWNGEGNRTFDSLEIVAHPDGKSSRLVARYSNTKQFRFPAKVDDTDPTYQSLSISFDKVRHEIPQAQYEAEAIKVQDKEQTKVKAAWLPSTRQVPAAHIILQRRVVLTGFPLELAVAIQAQIDHVHKLPVEPGLWGRFSAGDITEAEPGRWVCVYTWDCDPGNLIIEGCIPYPGKIHTCIVGLEPQDLVGPPGIQGVIAVPNAFFGVLPDSQFPIYARPPFCETALINDNADDGDGNPKAPSFDYVFDGVLDPNGWASLPGDPF